MRRAVAVVGDSGQLRAFDSLPGGGARDGCAVEQPQVVVPGRALRGQVQHGRVDQRGGGLDPLVVAGLFGQIREQVPKPAVTHSQPMMFASCAKQHLRRGQAHELGVGEPFRPPGPWPLRFDDMVVNDHIQFGEEGIKVRRTNVHRCPPAAAVPDSQPRLEITPKNRLFMDNHDFPSNVRKPVPDSTFPDVGPGEKRHSDDMRRFSKRQVSQARVSSNGRASRGRRVSRRGDERATPTLPHKSSRQSLGQLPKLDVPNAVEDRLPDAEIDAWQGNRRSLTCPPPKSYPPGIVTVTKMQWAFNPSKSDAVIKHVGVGAAAPHERCYPGESLAAIDMRAVLDAADVDHPVVFMCSERDTVIAAARQRAIRRTRTAAAWTAGTGRPARWR